MDKHIKYNSKILFGSRVKQLRLEKGISQESLALIAGLDRTYVSGCERGVRNIGLENIYKIASALGVTPDMLFKDKGAQDNDT